MGVKTAGVGHFAIPTAPAAGVSVTSGAANTFTTSAVQLIASTTAALYITGVHLEAAAAKAATYVMVQLMIGAAGVETIIGQYLVPLSTASTVALGYRQIYPFIPVASGVRISAKTADSVGAAATLVTLECIAQSNVVDDAIPITTVTTVNTLTTYTGNTPQTGDAFARLGAPAGASVSADVAAAKADTAAIKVKTDFLPSVLAGGAGGLQIAGTNAATSYASLTANITGNLSGSVGSVTGAVGSVTGAVGSVTGLTASNLDVAVSTRMATYTQPTGFLAATFPAAVASTTNITAGTITTVTNLTNAPTAGDLTATMKTSVTTAATAATPTAAAVTGNVGGNVTGSVGSVTGLAVANLDIAVSTRLASGSYTAPPSAAANAAAVRTELTVELGRIDAAISSRLAATSYTVPDNVSVAAIKVKTDQLEFTAAGKVDSNVTAVNSVAVNGIGTSGSPWGP